MLRALCSLLSVFSVSPVIELMIFAALVGIVFIIQIAL